MIKCYDLVYFIPNHVDLFSDNDVYLDDTAVFISSGRVVYVLHETVCWKLSDCLELLGTVTMKMKIVAWKNRKFLPRLVVFHHDISNDCVLWSFYE